MSATAKPSPARALSRYLKARKAFDKAEKALKAPLRRNKYLAKKAVYNGHLYHSQKEAAYAAELDIRVKAGEIEKWERQVRIPIEINGTHVCNYICDFVATHPGGHREYIEVKGYPNPVGELKVKLVRACYPKMDYRVVR